jgi:hypothetical protein
MKSSVFMKVATIRCASLSERASSELSQRDQWGLVKPCSQDTTPVPQLSNSRKSPELAPNLDAPCRRVERGKLVEQPRRQLLATHKTVTEAKKAEAAAKRPNVWLW